MSFGTLGSSEHGNNDWLISPELSGKAQTISFYEKAPQCDNANYGAEDFYVAYSTTDKASNHFTKIYDAKATKTSNGQSTQSICPRVLSTSLSFAPLRCL